MRRGERSAGVLSLPCPPQPIFRLGAGADNGQAKKKRAWIYPLTDLTKQPPPEACSPIATANTLPPTAAQCRRRHLPLVRSRFLTTVLVRQHSARKQPPPLRHHQNREPPSPGPRYTSPNRHCQPRQQNNPTNPLFNLDLKPPTPGAAASAMAHPHIDDDDYEYVTAGTGTTPPPLSTAGGRHGKGLVSARWRSRTIH